MPAAPTVSVVMCVYNAGRYLAQTLGGILDQTYRDFELVAVDDGSTDDSLPILQNFAKTDERVRIISRPNKGISASANEGVAAARGRYIARHDADDVSFPDRLEKQVAFLETHPDVVAVGAQMLITDPFGLVIEQTSLPTDHEAIERALLAGSGWNLPQPAATLHKDAFNKVGGYREKFSNSEDLDLFLRLATVGKLANMKEPLVHWRRHLQSVNHSRAASQAAMKRDIIAEALAARGLPIPPDLAQSLAYHNPLAPWKQLCIWGWKALDAGQARIARSHAWSAIRHRPTSGEAWKLAACAIRGH